MLDAGCWMQEAGGWIRVAAIQDAGGWIQDFTGGKRMTAIGKQNAERDAGRRCESARFPVSTGAQPRRGSLQYAGICGSRMNFVTRREEVRNPESRIQNPWWATWTL